MGGSDEVTRGRLYQPSTIREIRRDYDFKFTKSLGQNFLIDGNILNKMIEASEITRDDVVLEIGTGIGTLTQALAESAGQVFAVEIDKELQPILEDTLEEYDNIEILFDNFLDIDLRQEIESRFGQRPIKVVANLPYYVTTPILIKLLNSGINLQSIQIMVQKEMGERMIANPGTKDYGSLSVYVQLRTMAKIVINVPRTCFMPAPKVDSVVVLLKPKELPIWVDTDRMEKIVRAAFSKRRKTVLNALSTYGFICEREEIKNALIHSGIDPGTRAEDITIDQYLSLTNNFPAI